MKPLTLTYKAIRSIFSKIELFLDKVRTYFLLKINGVEFSTDLSSKGVPQIHVGKNARLSIKSGFRMNNGIKYNRIGRQGRCQLIVSDNATLTIGENVGISATAIICKHSIHVGDRVKIGGNVVIYDSDFHSLDSELRNGIDTDEINRKDAPVFIGDDVFIGAHATILKGVAIGEGAIVGACSVVTKDIPPFEVWAGNPAKCVRKNKPLTAFLVA